MDNNENKKVVTTKKKVVVQKPKVEEFDTSKSLEEHMKENQEKVKTRVDYKTIITYVIMSIIVIVCVLLLVHFCEASMKSLNKNTTTSLNYQLISTTTREAASIEYVKPSTIPTAATHTIFVGNQTRPVSTNQFDRTNNVSRKTTVSTKSTPATKPTESTKPTEETATSTTEPTTEKNDDNNEDDENPEENEEVGEN